MNEGAREADSQEEPRPTVAILKFAPLARDPRVLRQVRLLADTADVVTVGYGSAPEGVVRHIEIPAHLTSWRSNRVALLFLYILRRHARMYFGAERTRFVQEAIPRGSVDVILANDAIAVPVALRLAPRAGVHADLHEFAPKQGGTLQWRLLVAPFMRWACRVAVGADSVTTVAPGIVEEYRKDFGFDARVVENAPQFRDDLAPTEPGDPLRLVHIGIAGRARRLEVMIDAVAEVERRAPGKVVFDVLLAPGDPVYIEELTVRAAKVPGGVVRVLPPVPFEQMLPTLAGYDLGMFVCPPVTFNLRHALPNKFFEFVQARLGVVVGPSVEMAPLVKKFGFGVVAEGFDADSAADALEAMTREDVVRFKAASHAHAHGLSAEELSKPWSEAINAILSRARAGDGSA